MTARRSLTSLIVALAALILCGAIAIIAPATAQAKDYQFNETSMRTVTVHGVSKGTVTYNKKTHTLTLKNVTAKAKGGYTTLHSMGINNLKIKLIGTNKIKAGDFDAFICLNVTISGKGKLYLTGKSGESTISCKKFTLKSGTVKVTNGETGLYCESATIKGGALKVSKCSTGIYCAGWDKSKGTKVKHGGGSLTMKGGKVALTKIKTYAVTAQKFTVKKKAQLTMSGNTGTHGLNINSGCYTYGGKTWTWGGTVTNYGKITGKNMASAIYAEAKLYNAGTIDGTGSQTSAVCCGILQNTGTIIAKSCGFNAYEAVTVASEGTVIK